MIAKPEWLSIRAPQNKDIEFMEHLLNQLSLQTVCQNAMCPNIGECFRTKTATFMILGKICTRNCNFCAVIKGCPVEPDPTEPMNVASAVNELKYVVITSVTRDDLHDGGAGHFSKVINCVRVVNPGVNIEVLIPDFMGKESDIKTVIYAGPDVLNHNVETVPRLYSKVRPGANYKRSIELLKSVKHMSHKTYTKSGIMVGLGESDKEVLEVFKHLRNAKCDILTIGHYLRPSKKHTEVHEFVPLQKFKYYEDIAKDMGFLYVLSGPLVRSSYKASEIMTSLKNCN